MNREDDLYDFIEEFSEIQCSASKCFERQTELGDAGYAMKWFYDKGWRATKRGNVYCPKHAKERLKT